MKALTLHQPWASLIALGFKTYETRSWGTDYRGPLAIHAAKAIHNYAREYYEDEIQKYFRVYLPSDLREWPKGEVVCVVSLTDCIPTSDKMEKTPLPTKDPADPCNTIDQRRFGDFHEGRFAWKLENINMQHKLVGHRVLGCQKLWDIFEPCYI